MGLIVLGIFVIYLLVTALLAWGFAAIGRRENKPWMKKRWVWLVMFLIPTWDVPIGKINFKRYCNAEAGIEVYRRVGLEDEFYLEPGLEIRKSTYHKDGGISRRKTLTDGNELDIKKVNQEFTFVRQKREKDISRWGYIDRLIMEIKTKQGVLLGRATYLEGGSSWLNENISQFDSPGVICPKKEKDGTNITDNLYDQVFYRKRDGMNRGARNAHINK